jgi:hypothetical protein
LIGLIGTYGMFGLLTFFLLDRAYLPERVAYTMPLFMLAVCLYWASGFPSVSRQWWIVPAPCFGARRATFLRFAVLALVPLWAVLYGVQFAAWTRDLGAMNGANSYLKNEVSPRIFDQFRHLLPAGKKPVLIPVNFSAPAQVVECLFFHTGEDLPFTLVPYGWLVQSPLFHQVLNQHGLNPYSVSLLDRPDVFFSMDPKWVEPLRIFYREHYGLDVRFDRVRDRGAAPEGANDQSSLYQAHVVPGEVPSADRFGGLPPTAGLPGRN